MLEKRNMMDSHGKFVGKFTGWMEDEAINAAGAEVIRIVDEMEKELMKRDEEITRLQGRCVELECKLEAKTA